MDFLSAGRKKSGVCGEVAFSRLLAEVHLYIYACSLMQLEWNEASSNFFQPANWHLGLLQFPLVYKLFDCERICHFTRSYSGPSFMHPISVAPTTGLLSFMHIFTLCILRSNF